MMEQSFQLDDEDGPVFVSYRHLIFSLVSMWRYESATGIKATKVGGTHRSFAYQFFDDDGRLLLDIYPFRGCVDWIAFASALDPDTPREMLQEFYRLSGAEDIEGITEEDMLPYIQEERFMIAMGMDRPVCRSIA